jgi:hypothetical protein
MKTSIPWEFTAVNSKGYGLLAVNSSKEYYLFPKLPKGLNHQARLILEII